MSSLRECFLSYGVAPRHPRRSWSGRSADGKTVVLALWQDLFTRENNRLVYDGREEGLSVENFAVKERLENLIWAREFCGSQFRCIVAIPRNARVLKRQIAECTARPDLILTVTEIDERTGGFLAEATRRPL